jgi:hypothetical protein
VEVSRKPRILFVNGSTYDLPLPAGLARGWDAISDQLDVRVIARRGVVTGYDDRFRLVGADALSVSGRAFYARLSLLVSKEIRRFRPDVVSAQSPYEAFAVCPPGPSCPCARSSLLPRNRVGVKPNLEHRRQ